MKNFILLVGGLLICLAIGLASIFAAVPYSKLTLRERKQLLRAQAPQLNPKLLDKAVIVYSCAENKKVAAIRHLVLVDFSMPSNKKRLWIFDLRNNKLLYNTWVAHGMKSGKLYPTFFSNEPGSKASSLGLCKTGLSYRGKHGHSLKLHGLEPNFNDNLLRRFVVIHGAWYVSKAFIKKYGRIGRTWGCLGVSKDLVKPIVNAVENNALILVYYPDKTWLSNSRFLNCNLAKRKNNG